MDGAFYKIQILYIVWQIQTELLTHFGDGLRICTFLQHQGNRVTRYYLKQNKRDQADAQKNKDRLEQTFSCV